VASAGRHCLGAGRIAFGRGGLEIEPGQPLLERGDPLIHPASRSGERGAGAGGGQRAGQRAGLGCRGCHCGLAEVRAERQLVIIDQPANQGRAADEGQQ
jgi:hypothetical protein